MQLYKRFTFLGLHNWSAIKSNISSCYSVLIVKTLTDDWETDFGVVVNDLYRWTVQNVK